MYYDLEIVIPVLNEKDNISKTLSNILESVKLNFRIIIVYDYENDPTLDVIKKNFETNKIYIVKSLIGFTDNNVLNDILPNSCFIKKNLTDILTSYVLLECEDLKQ